MRILRKIFRFLLWTLGIILFLIVLILVLVQTAPVQEFITNKIETQLRQQLGTDLGIGYAALEFPTDLAIGQVYINTPAGDTLARLGKLTVDLDMWALFRQEVVIQDIAIQDVFAHVDIRDSSSNIDFLLDAFLVTDTTATATPDTAAAAPWLITLDNTTLALTNADIYYRDDPTGILLDMEVGTLKGNTESIDLSQQHYRIDQLQLADAKIKVRIGESQNPSTDPIAEMLVSSNEVLIDNTHFAYQMEGIDIKTYLQSAQLGKTEAVIGEKIHMDSEGLQVAQSSFTMDTPAAPISGDGLDYNHLALSGIAIDVKEVQMRGDTIELRLLELQGRERSGLALEHTEGSIFYTPQQISLQDFVLRSSRSVIRAPEANVWYDFTGNAPLEEMRIKVDLNGDLAVRDVMQLAPEMAQMAVLRDNARQSLRFTARASGNGRSILVDRLNLDGPGILLRSEANIRYPFDPERIEGRLQLEDLVARPNDLLPLVPDTLLPADIDWPDRLVARGNFNYQNDQLQLSLFALEERPGTQRPSRVDVSGQVNGLRAYPNTTFDLSLDSLLLTRTSALAYLPPESIPEGYRIPDFVRGNGRVSGEITNLNVDVRVGLAGDRTFAQVQGNILNATDPDSLRLDLKLSDLSIAAADVNAIIPDSLLPAGFKLPDIRTQTAYVKGSLQDLEFDVPLQTSNGNLDIDGRYNPKDLDINLVLSELELKELFEGAYADSIATLDLRDLRLEATLRGAIEPDLNLDFFATMYEKRQGRVMVANGQALGQVYSGDFAFTHPDFMASGRGTYDASAPRVKVNAYVEIERVDMVRWDLSERELFVSGSMAVEADGIDPNAMEARLAMQNVILRGDTSAAYIDSLVANISLDSFNNNIQLRSDVMTADLEGYFDVEDIGGEINRYIQGYWDESVRQPEPVANGKRMVLNVKLVDPRPLTSGFIPGLQDLSPMQLNFKYREQSPELVLDMNIPHLKYAGVELDNLVGNATGNEKLAYNFDWGSIDLPGQFEIGRTQLQGESTNGGVSLNILVTDNKDSTRHRLMTWVDPEADDLRLRFEEEQILNYETWEMPSNNLIRLRDEQLTIEDWELRSGNQLMSLATPQPNDIVGSFDHFNLNVLSRLVNTEGELASGEMNGELRIDNALAQPAIAGDLQIQNLTVMTAPLGNLDLDMQQESRDNYLVDVSLQGEGNDLRIGGSYRPSGSLDLDVAINQFQLSTIDPFSLENTEETQGTLVGQLDITGDIEAPDFNGQVRFQDASTRISLLGAQLRVGEQAVVFNGKTVRLDALTLYDAKGQEANVSGELIIRSLTDFAFNFDIQASDFLVMDSDVDDNDLYYGYLVVDAEVSIRGDILQPDLEVSATPKGDSRLVYRYSVSALQQEQLTAGVVTFAEQYEWDRIIEQGRMQEEASIGVTGLYMLLNLNVNDNLRVTVVIDPITGDQFTGRGEGDLTFVQYPNGRQEMTGRVEMIDGVYDFTYQNLIKKRFEVDPGSNIFWTGEVINPNLDLTINHTVRTSPYPLVTLLNPEADAEGGLRRKQTFVVKIMLDGDLQKSNLSTNIVYPDNVPGNAGFTTVNSALTSLRNNPSRMNTQAFGLLLFGGFTGDGGDGGGGDLVDNQINARLDQALTSQLNKVTNRFIKFVDLDFGVDSYQDQGGQTQRNLRLSLRKTLFNDRLIISVDGVAGTNEDEIGNSATYLDNLTAEYLLNEEGNLRIKIFSDRDRNVLVGGNVVRLGGRLVFSKDFRTLSWLGGGQKEKKEEKAEPIIEQDE